MTTVTTATGVAVRSTGLAKSYGTVQALRGVDLEIMAGEVVALLGPNGAGKSTAIDMLLGLARPDRGTAEIFGRDPRRAVADGAVGAMLQSGSLLPDVTVGEIVETFASLHRAPLSVAETLRRAGIADLARRRTAKLSGGQAQRVRFALAVAPDPDLLMLDEPTVGMDVETRRSFWATMRELTASGRTVLFATHYLDEADAYADRIVVLREGQIAADGTSAAIKSKVADRTISATVPGSDLARLTGLPGVSEAQTRGDQVTLRCSDSDAALRALLGTYDQASEIEVTNADLEDAFIALTTDIPTAPGSLS